MKDFDSRITRLKEQLRELKEGCYFSGRRRQERLLNRKIKKAEKSKLYYERRDGGIINNYIG